MTKRKDNPAKGGRPTKYEDTLPLKLLKHFESEIKAGRLPFFSRFARTIANVCEDTAIEWTKKHPEFSEAYKKAKDVQKEFLIESALTGKFDRTFSIFTAKNITDMRDKHETDITSGGKPIPLMNYTDVRNNLGDQENQPAKEAA